MRYILYIDPCILTLRMKMKSTIINHNTKKIHQIELNWISWNSIFDGIIHTYLLLTIRLPDWLDSLKDAEVSPRRPPCPPDFRPPSPCKKRFTLIFFFHIEYYNKMKRKNCVGSWISNRSIWGVFYYIHDLISSFQIDG